MLVCVVINGHLPLLPILRLLLLRPLYFSEVFFLTLYSDLPQQVLVGRVVC